VRVCWNRNRWKVLEVAATDASNRGYPSHLADPNIDLLSIRRENAVAEGEAQMSERSCGNVDDEPLEATVEGSYVNGEEEYRNLIAAEKVDPDSVPGVVATPVVR
jgi:hypothetical protein